MKKSPFLIGLAATLIIALVTLPVFRISAQTPGQDRLLVQGPTGSRTATGAASRFALVIGNGAYTQAPVLKNPTNDATDMAAALRKVDFDVVSGINLTQRQMKAMIREFGQKLKAGGQGLFYYAGHGVQLRGRNYVIPVDADISSEADVEDQGVDVNFLMGLMDEAGNGLNVVILDACRNNPFARSFRSTGAGLAQMDAPTGTLIAYSTAPGRVASDGTGRNGAYTAELLKQLAVPGLTVEEVMKRVRASLKQQTSGQQVPWESSSLVGDFIINRAASAGNAGSPTTAFDPAAIELSFWESIKNSQDPADFRAYLDKYGEQGKFAPLAKNRLNTIEATRRTVESKPNPSAGNSGTPANPSTAPEARTAGAPYRSPEGIDFVYVPAGSFDMGSPSSEANHYPDEGPQHRVTISQGFYLGRTEVTQEQWKSVMGTNPSNPEGDDLPVGNVSWDDATEFIRLLNAQNGSAGYRLPTEAEWEYACRAGTAGPYPGDVKGMAWNNATSGGHVHAVGTGRPNAWGLYDMPGNVWEWVQDWFGSYRAGAQTDPTGASSGSSRVYRGGGFNNPVEGSRSANRVKRAPGTHESNVGFRLARTILPEKEPTGGNLAGSPNRNPYGIEFVSIPAGTFTMGSPAGEANRGADEGPQHQVTISRSFFIGKYEVTQGQWQAVMGTNPSYFKNCDQCPVEQVSWNDAQEFVRKLDALNNGFNYRLPTEAEWEYAARAGTTTPFAFGSSLNSAQANLNVDYPQGDAAKGEYRKKTTPVGSFRPNAWGVYDMHGNVWEWCQDWYSENYYANSPATDPEGPGSGQYRVLRGGSWSGDAGYARSAGRSWPSPDVRVSNDGFRVVAVRRTP